MTFRLTPLLNDGKNDPPPVEVEVEDDLPGIDQLLDHLLDEMTNDFNGFFGVGFTLKIERIA